MRGWRAAASFPAGRRNIPGKGNIPFPWLMSTLPEFLPSRQACGFRFLYSAPPAHAVRSGGETKVHFDEVRDLDERRPVGRIDEIVERKEVTVSFQSQAGIDHFRVGFNVFK